jgi:hypothetical protein
LKKSTKKRDDKVFFKKSEKKRKKVKKEVDIAGKGGIQSTEKWPWSLTASWIVPETAGPCCDVLVMFMVLVFWLIGKRVYKTRRVRL